MALWDKICLLRISSGCWTLAEPTRCCLDLQLLAVLPSCMQVELSLHGVILKRLLREAVTDFVGVLV
jgi:hypothetical protein